MQRKIWKVIEAARSLRLSIMTSGGEEKVRIRGSAREFPGRLLALQKALDELDSEGGLMLSDNAQIGLLERELSLHRKGFEDVFRWMRENGVDITEPYALLEEALEIPEGKRARVFSHKPEYGKKKGKKKPKQTARNQIQGAPAEEPVTIQGQDPAARPATQAVPPEADAEVRGEPAPPRPGISTPGGD